MRKSQPFKRPYKWIVVCLLLAASVNLVGFAAQPKTVSIKVDGQTITLQTRALTVQGALEEAGVVLQKADGYELVGEEEKLNDGATIEVTRAMPVKVWKAGRTTEYTIGRKTVRDVLNAVGVDYKGFQVYPGLDTEVTPDMTIHIISPTNKLTTETRDIPYEVEMRNNDNLPRGRQNVISPGQNGQEKVTYREIKVGSETVRQELNREVLSEPVPEIVEVGTGNNLNMIETSPWFRPLPLCPDGGSIRLHHGRRQRHRAHLHRRSPLSWGGGRGSGRDPLRHPDVHPRLRLCCGSGLRRRHQRQYHRPVHGRLWRCHFLGPAGCDCVFLGVKDRRKSC